MKISNYSVKGIFVSQGCHVFGKDADAINYNYVKILRGEEVLMIKVPQDKVGEVASAEFEEYAPIELLIDIDMELDSKGGLSSKYKTVLSYAGYIPFDIKKSKGDK